MLPLLLLIFPIFIFAVPPRTSHSSDYDLFSMKILNEIKSGQTCKASHLFIMNAAREENNPRNADNVILYHGQTYGTWVYQLLLKAFQYPEVQQADWLPLRPPLQQEKEISKIDLLSKIDQYSDDHDEDYKDIGLSASYNLVSKQELESAWSLACSPDVSPDWTAVSGCSGCLENVLDNLVHSFIPASHHSKFKTQWKLIMAWIQEKRKLLDLANFKKFLQFAQEMFPRTFEKYRGEFEKTFSERDPWSDSSQSDSSSEPDDLYTNLEGVILQIIIPKPMSNQLCYSSHPFGYPHSLKNPRFMNDHFDYIYDNDSFEDFTEIYDKIKNKEDKYQVRIAMNDFFRSFPSPVKIKALHGLKPVEAEIVYSMVQELTESYLRIN